MTQWQFRTLNPNDTSGTSTAEDNFAQEERTSVDILVRECIQNPLDARLDNENIKVHFKWRTLDLNKSTFARDLLTEEFKNQQSSAGITKEINASASVDILVIEDFGTIGLRGRYDDSATEGDDQNWNAFWFREGEGAKPSKANGGAGQGKLTMYVASQIRMVAALTTRAADGERLLFGSCRFRRNYVIGKDRYAREARWGNTSDANKLSMPIQDNFILNNYEKELQIQRGTKTGTTFLIPMPDPAITPEAITTAIINEFYFPILRGTLTVYINEQEISNITITELATKFSSNLRLAAPYRLFLDEIAKKHLNEKTPSTFDKRWGSTSKLSSDHLPVGQIETMRNAFQNGEIISAIFPISVSSIANGSTLGFLRVFLQDAEPDKIHELFIRQDLAIDKEKSLRTAKRLAPARALILVDDDILSRFLAAAEEPTHREWNGSRPKLALQFRSAAVTLKLVRHAASRLLELLVPPATKDNLALASFFPDVAAKKETGKPNLRKKNNELTGNDDDPLPRPPAKQRKLELHALDDGAWVYVNPDFANSCIYPLFCKLELAYATDLGKPFDQWDSADFYLTEKSSSINFTDVQNIVPRGNEISFEISGPQGSILISGFDKNRQLEMRLKYTEDSDANSI
jgi:hypothetical protein